MKVKPQDIANLVVVLNDFVNWLGSDKGVEVLSYPSATVISRMMELGGKSDKSTKKFYKKSDVWMSNAETRSINKQTPSYFVHHRIKDLEQALDEYNENIKKFIRLAHGDEALSQSAVAKQLQMSRTTYWRRKNEWYRDIFIKLRNRGII